MKNAYEILGVTENASDDDIRSAYRELVKKKHPDKHGNSAVATKEFEEIKKSYDVLKDPVLRGEHDFALAKFKGKDIPATAMDESLAEWFGAGEEEEPRRAPHHQRQRTTHNPHDRRMDDEELPDGFLGRSGFFSPY